MLNPLPADITEWSITHKGLTQFDQYQLWYLCIILHRIDFTLAAGSSLEGVNLDVLGSGLGRLQSQ